MGNPMTRSSGRRILLCVLAVIWVMGVVCTAKESGPGIEFDGEDKSLRLSVRLTGTTGGSRGETAFLGQRLRYDARVRNISSGTVRVPAPVECLDVVLTKEPQCMFMTGVGGRGGEVATLMPEQELKFSGEFTLLYTNVCYVRASFHNSRTQQVRQVLVPHGEPAGHYRAMISTPIMVPITNVWVGQIPLSMALDTSSYLAGDLRTRYSIAMRKVLAFEQGEQAMTNFSPSANGKVDLDHPNISQQSEVVSLVRHIGADANSEAVDWLWECFAKSRKNSPAHVASMFELYRLLTEGVGVEHAQRFLDVAKAPSIQEAIVTRLYAMDAAALYCVRNQFFCRAKGNRFLTHVTPEIQKEARGTLEALTTDGLRDIHTRAKRLLGIAVPASARGMRKYIKTTDEKDVWHPDQEQGPLGSLTKGFGQDTTTPP